MDKIGIYIEIGPNLAQTINNCVESRGSGDTASDVIDAFDLKEMVEVAVIRTLEKDDKRRD